MRTPAARWWAPAVTPAAIGLIALGSTSVALAGIDLTTSLRDAEPAAAPIETELTPVTPADDGADTPAPVDDAAPTEEVVDDDAVDVATPTPSITVPDVDTGEVADAATDVVEDVAETVTDVTDAVDLPGVGLGGARSSNNAGGAQRADIDGGNGNGNGNAGGNDNGNGGGKPDEPPGQVGRDEPVAPPAEQPDAGDDQHPSGRDRSVEPGGSGAQGGAQSDPDDDGRGPAFRRAPSRSSSTREVIVIRETDPIEARASPRNPRVEMENRSSEWTSLEVAWRVTASSSSADEIPDPSSATSINFFPASSMLIVIERAPASREFSRSSFTTDAGRSMTSPAAICEATSEESSRMGMTGL